MITYRIFVFIMVITFAIGLGVSMMLLIGMRKILGSYIRQFISSKHFTINTGNLDMGYIPVTSPGAQKMHTRVKVFSTGNAFTICIFIGGVLTAFIASVYIAVISMI